MVGQRQYDKQYYEDHEKQRQKQYRETHKKETKQYYENNKEQIKQYQKKYNKQYQINHKKELKQYRETYKEEKKEYDKNYNQNHKEQRKRYHETHKEYYLIKKNEYRRFIRTDIILNQSFPKSNLHHIRNGVGIYIPMSIHKNVSHCLKTGRNMNIINDKVDLWLDDNNIQVMEIQTFSEIMLPQMVR